jgi:predicted amidophosphoribosyltransferase
MSDKVKWLDEYCNQCGAQLNSWDKRCSKALAYKMPCCEKCIAKEYDITADELRGKLEEVFGMRPCMGI